MSLPTFSRRTLPALFMALLAGTSIARAQLAQRTDNPFPSPALFELFQAEQAFAKASVENGMRAAFLEYFAPEGINFTPHPVNTRDSLNARPAPPVKPPITLDWWPVTGDISSAGDLGYTTGPYVLKDSRENNKIVGQGFYFSVWKKQPDGAWRVVVDYGSEIPHWLGDRTPLEFQPSRWAVNPPKTVATATRETLFARDRSFAELSLRSGTITAYKRFSTWDAETRLYRDNMNPIIGREQIAKALGRLKVKFQWQPLAAGVAESADLAFTYGKWETTDRANRIGYYLRVWRQNRGQWRVSAEVMNPLPSQ